jgi:hypothetical protein
MSGDCRPFSRSPEQFINNEWAFGSRPFRLTVSGMAARRRRGEDSISFDHRKPCTGSAEHAGCTGRWRAEVSLGYDTTGKRVKKKVTASTKTELIDKLRELRDDLDTGVTDRRQGSSRPRPG